MFETAILVLLYNKEIKDSNTLNSLTELKDQYHNAKLIIWNNGPSPLNNVDCQDFKDLGYDVSIEETINNESLAVIYNKFLVMERAKKYVLLDDDSVLNATYILASSNCTGTDVGMPIITTLGSIQSPRIDDKPYSPEIELDDNCKIITIGSGLVIGVDIVNKLKDNYDGVFDERFYLYGVDSTFCLRLFYSKLNDKIKVISGFSHSLSRLEKESIKQTKFRQLERSYDLGLTLRHYSSLPYAIITLLLIIIGSFKRMIFRKKQIISLPPLIKAFLSGRHYRQCVGV
ncbi:hypothetical protein N9740_06640 [Pseudomonadales bacterium]|nr:hypothetical protein [Pseudomonadales bacterium]